MTVESMVPAMLTIIKEWVCLSLPVSHSIALEFHTTVSLLNILMSAGLIVKFFSVLFLVLTYVVYKPPEEPRPNPAVLSPEVDFMTTRRHTSCCKF
ncbi:hypothetical protein EB796_013701 [Bugula neritina]|uniref:Uncharacterized protein n=1 Tax=Bugula neritina TaxID=10212 RepID=A0A7J7JPS9_BUGNE|nr:hypothetical protein EB796_013701 [Bugula neritina]